MPNFCKSGTREEMGLNSSLAQGMDRLNQTFVGFEDPRLTCMAPNLTSKSKSRPIKLKKKRLSTVDESRHGSILKKNKGFLSSKRR